MRGGRRERSLGLGSWKNNFISLAGEILRTREKESGT